MLSLILHNLAPAYLFPSLPRPCPHQADAATWEMSSHTACLSILSTGMALEDLSFIDLV